MGRLDTSRAAELRVLAEKFRRRAKEMTLHNYVKLMRKAASDLEAEARDLEQHTRIQPGSHLDIRI